MVIFKIFERNMQLELEQIQKLTISQYIMPLIEWMVEAKEKKNEIAEQKSPF